MTPVPNHRPDYLRYWCDTGNPDDWPAHQVVNSATGEAHVYLESRCKIEDGTWSIDPTQWACMGKKGL